MSPALSSVLIVRDAAKQLFCPELGTLYKALSAEASTAYGLSPVFCVHDELGQVRGPRSELYEALETAASAHEDPMSIIISTQAPNDNDLLSILIDDAKSSADPRTVLSLYTANASDDPFSEESIKQANPAFGDFQNAKEVLATAENARRMPSREAEYRNLILNQRVEMNAPFISKSVWDSCSAAVKDFEMSPVYGGLDLSSVHDLTAKVYIANVGGIWQIKPTFWLPANGLVEKSRSDRVPYDQWEKSGYLLTAPGKTVSYEYVARTVFEDFQRYNIQAIAFDRWNWSHMKPWLSQAGFSEDQLEGDNAVFKEFGQGFRSMSPALRDLESELLESNMAHGGHPVLTMCVANAVVTSDQAGNRKLDKAKASGRIDGVVALAMAKAIAGTHEEAGPSVYADRGVLVL